MARCLKNNYYGKNDFHICYPREIVITKMIQHYHIWNLYQYRHYSYWTLQPQGYLPNSRLVELVVVKPVSQVHILSQLGQGS